MNFFLNTNNVRGSKNIKASKNLKFCIATTKQYLDNGSMKDTWIGSWEKNGRT